MVSTAPEIYPISKNEQRYLSVDMRKALDTGELLTGAPTVTEDDTNELTITEEAVNVSDLTINGKVVSAGGAVRFKVDASSAVETDYVISIICGTTGGQVVHGRVCLEVVD